MRVLNNGNNMENDVKQEVSPATSTPDPSLTLTNLPTSSIHFKTQPLVYQPKLKSSTNKPPAQYKLEEEELNLKNLKTVKLIKTFLEEQKANLKDLNIVKFAKDIINFKLSKFEELKDFLKYKTSRWEKILTKKKNKLTELLSNNEILDFKSLENFKEARVEDLVELIKLKKLKLEELIALNELLKLKESKIQEVKNLIDFKKSKIEELFSPTNNVFVYPEESLSEYISFSPSNYESEQEIIHPDNIAYEGRGSSSEIRFLFPNYSNI